jgi:hypothetical protein
MRPLVAIATLFVSVLVVPAFAQTWQATFAPSRRWNSVASSADGKKLIASAHDYPLLYSSTTSGIVWFVNGAPSNSWVSVASSADGTRLIATAAVIFNPAGGGFHPGPIYTSADSGQTWQLTPAPSNQWCSVASSGDGSILVAAAAYSGSSIDGGLIFVSTNAGTDWVATTAPSNRWYSVACSADGTRMVAGASGIFTSTNSGTTWISNDIPWDVGDATPIWRSAACSADGGTILAARELNYYTSDPRIYVSTNFGNLWTSTDLPDPSISSVAASADGSSLIASMAHVYLSTNSGISWTQESIPGEHFGWGSGLVALSADGGRRFLALGADDAGNPNTVFTVLSHPAPHLQITAPGTNVVLTWTVTSANSVVVQETSDLSTANWVFLTNAPTVDLIKVQNRLVLPAVGSSGFYRVRTH